MVKTMGYRVLELPPQYCILNPFENNWHQLKSRVKYENISPILNSSVVELVRYTIVNIPTQGWKKVLIM